MKLMARVKYLLTFSINYYFILIFCFNFCLPPKSYARNFTCSPFFPETHSIISIPFVEILESYLAFLNLLSKCVFPTPSCFILFV